MTRAPFFASFIVLALTATARADGDSDVQFQIQLGTSDLQNAENVRSQAAVAAIKIRKVRK